MRVEDLGLRVKGLEFRVCDIEFKFKICSFGFGIQGLDRVSGLKVRVWG